jgi:hypothetical protein
MYEHNHQLDKLKTLDSDLEERLFQLSVQVAMLQDGTDMLLQSLRELLDPIIERP